MQQQEQTRDAHYASEVIKFPIKEQSLRTYQEAF